jgi:hypothetical protein
MGATQVPVIFRALKRCRVSDFGLLWNSFAFLLLKETLAISDKL